MVFALDETSSNCISSKLLYCLKDICPPFYFESGDRFKNGDFFRVMYQWLRCQTNDLQTKILPYFDPLPAIKDCVYFICFILKTLQIPRVFCKKKS